MNEKLNELKDKVNGLDFTNLPTELTPEQEQELLLAMQDVRTSFDSLEKAFSK